MKKEIDNLITVSSYAKRKGISVPWVYKQIKSGKIKPVVIDGVNFIEI